MGSHYRRDRRSSHHALVEVHRFPGMVLDGTCAASLTDDPRADGGSQAGSALGWAHRSGVGPWGVTHGACSTT